VQPLGKLAGLLGRSACLAAHRAQGSGLTPRRGDEGSQSLPDGVPLGAAVMLALGERVDSLPGAVAPTLVVIKRTTP
jgi:hypothetical protein